MVEVSTARAEAVVEEGFGEGFERELLQMRRGRRKMGLRGRGENERSNLEKGLGRIKEEDLEKDLEAQGDVAAAIDEMVKDEAMRDQAAGNWCMK